MKCALELAMVRQEADILWEKEEAKKDEIAKKYYKAAVVRSIEFCDTTLDAALTACANRREKIRYAAQIQFDIDRLGNKLFKFVKPDGTKYADGTLSYSALGENYAWKEFVDYLHSHCFEVNVYSGEYYSYGWGKMGCKTIVIEVRQE